MKKPPKKKRNTRRKSTKKQRASDPSLRRVRGFLLGQVRHVMLMREAFGKCTFTRSDGEQDDLLMRLADLLMRLAFAKAAGDSRAAQLSEQCQKLLSQEPLAKDDLLAFMQEHGVSPTLAPVLTPIELLQRFAARMGIRALEAFAHGDPDAIRFAFLCGEAAAEIDFWYLARKSPGDSATEIRSRFLQLAKMRCTKAQVDAEQRRDKRRQAEDALEKMERRYPSLVDNRQDDLLKKKAAEYLQISKATLNRWLNYDD